MSSTSVALMTARGIDIAEEADLAADALVDRPVGADDDHVGLDPPAPQFGDGVLRRLGLELLGRSDERDKRDVDVDGVRLAQVLAQLTDRLEEGEALDVTDGPSHLGDDHIHFGVAESANPGLDLVGDVGDHLDGVSQVVATPLLLDHRLVNGAGGHVRGAPQVLTGEALVVAQVEVGLAAVVCDEHLAVLERVHRARVDIDVRVEFLVDHPQTARL